MLETMKAYVTLQFNPEQVDADDMEAMLLAALEENPSIDQHGFKVEDVTMGTYSHAGLFEPPNLDCLADSDLASLAVVFQRLLDYARKKTKAMAWRLEGRVTGAAMLESELEQMYQRLPAAYRW